MILTSTERDAIQALITLAHATHLALDDSEEFEGPEGRSHGIAGQNFDDICQALGVLEELPDDKPGETLAPGGRAEWALRRLLTSSLIDQELQTPVATKAPAQQNGGQSKMHISPTGRAWVNPAEAVQTDEFRNALAAVKRLRKSQNAHRAIADGYGELRRALAELPKIEHWYVVGAPWGKGDFIVAGHPDPHIGRYVADTEDFNGEGENVLEHAAFIAAANPVIVWFLLQERDALIAAFNALQGGNAADERLTLIRRAAAQDQAKEGSAS